MNALNPGDQVFGVGGDSFQDHGVGPELKPALLDERVVVAVGAEAAEPADQGRPWVDLEDPRASRGTPCWPSSCIRCIWVLKPPSALTRQHGLSVSRFDSRTSRTRWPTAWRKRSSTRGEPALRAF